MKSSLICGGMFLCLAMCSQAQETSLFRHPQNSPSAELPQHRAQLEATQQSDLQPVQQDSIQPSPLPSPVQSVPYTVEVNPDHGLALNNVSWTYQPAPPMRRFAKNDIITIRVDEIARMQAQGDAQKRRSAAFSAVLTDWIQLSKGHLGPAAQTDGDPAIAETSNDVFRNQSTVQSRETISFNLAATIVDIKPNGNLVLEARKSIRVNDNVWETALTGTCRAIDVGPDNVVLSKALLDLEIQKEDQGQLRDGYKRGWFMRWLDRLQPF